MKNWSIGRPDLHKLNWKSIESEFTDKAYISYFKIRKRKFFKVEFKIDLSFPRRMTHYR